ncbi:MAG: ECF transporter S component [Blautia sp.]|nr:ECF transporter S component [Oliverpabstia sp.]MDY4000459.1 ECF transporter S component [Blautia sp.]
MYSKSKKITIIGMFCAVAYVTMVFGRIPVVLFLKYDPKDVIITIGGFLLGPLCSLIISVIVSFIEMLSVSETGFIGCIMNIISSCSFACIAAAIYKKKHDMKGAAIGLTCGLAAMVTVMLLWNYYITPIYMGYPRQAVKELLLPAFLPFNLIKGGINMALTFLLYRPVVTALRKSGLIDESHDFKAQKAGRRAGIMLGSTFMIATCIFGILILRGVI